MLLLVFVSLLQCGKLNKFRFLSEKMMYLADFWPFFAKKMEKLVAGRFPPLQIISPRF
jgi:hypothetical protein